MHPSSGKVRPVFSACGHPVQGEAWRAGGKWYVLRAESGELVLQVGATKIRFSEISAFTIRSKGGGWATASIEAAGSVLRVDYQPASRRWWNRWDPTLDGLDEEFSDFPVRVMRQWESASRGSDLACSWSE